MPPAATRISTMSKSDVDPFDVPTKANLPGAERAIGTLRPPFCPTAFCGGKAITLPSEPIVQCLPVAGAQEGSGGVDRGGVNRHAAVGAIHEPDIPWRQGSRGLPPGPADRV